MAEDCWRVTICRARYWEGGGGRCRLRIRRRVSKASEASDAEPNISLGRTLRPSPPRLPQPAFLLLIIRLRISSDYQAPADS